MKALIDKYFNGTTSEQELKEIEAYFLSHKEDLEKYFSESDWEKLNYVQTSNRLLPDNFIYKMVFPNHARKVRRKRLLYILGAAAACLVLFITTGKFNKAGKPPLASTFLNNKPTVYRNTTSKVISALLPDSSFVKLSPNSVVSIQAGYNKPNRLIELEGEAVFYVHKDKEHRFIVSSGNVKTTALGTIFRVINPVIGKITVKLIEGKILVEEKGSNDKTYYLLPGKTIAYESATRTFTVTGDNKEDNTKRENESSNKNETPVEPVKPVAERSGIAYKNEEMVFTDARLSDVLKTLAKDYHVNIAYPMEKVSRIRVAGSINKAQDIRKTLRDIAAMNKFHLEEDSVAQKFTLY